MLLNNHRKQSSDYLDFKMIGRFDNVDLNVFRFSVLTTNGQVDSRR
jgi:hypothetical protein